MTASTATYLRQLTDIRHAGTYRLPMANREAVLEAGHALGYLTLRIDFTGDTGKADALATLARILAFPDWFGHNWDALSDCLTDLSWLPAKGYVLLLESTEGLAGEAPEDFATLIEIFEEVADHWRRAGVPFWVLVEGDEEDMPVLDARGEAA